MGLFNSTKQESNFVTYYTDEEGLHPQIRAAFDWSNKFFDSHIGATYRDHVVLAGGALRSFFTDTPIRDWDLYCTQNALSGLTAQFQDFFTDGYNWAKIAETNLSYTYRKLDYSHGEQKITDVTANVIKKPFDTLERVIDSFDFTVCMCAISKHAIVYHPDYFTDLSTRSLRVHNPGDPLASLWRLQKYVQLGYTMTREDLWKIAQDIYHLDGLPTLVAKEEKNKHSLKENVKTLDEIFRSS